MLLLLALGCITTASGKYKMQSHLLLLISNKPYKKTQILQLVSICLTDMATFKISLHHVSVSIPRQFDNGLLNSQNHTMIAIISTYWNGRRVTYCDVVDYVEDAVESVSKRVHHNRFRSATLHARNMCGRILWLDDAARYHTYGESCDESCGESCGESCDWRCCTVSYLWLMTLATNLHPVPHQLWWGHRRNRDLLEDQVAERFMFIRVCDPEQTVRLLFCIIMFIL